MEERLNYMLSLVDALKTFEQHKPQSLIEKLAFERALQMCIETILDVGNQMIDGFIMRDPGSYKDIIDILEDEKVVPKTEANALIQLVNARKALMQEYTTIDHSVLWETYVTSAQAIRQFPKHVNDYIQQMLPPVHAFKTKDNGKAL